MIRYKTCSYPYSIIHLSAKQYPLIKDYNITGIDLDWEYPGSNNACYGNIFSAEDEKNFFNLTKNIKHEINNIEISMAVTTNPWTKNKDHIKYLDYINIMAYDINGAYWSSETGSNSPYDSILEGVENWKKLGLSNEQIIVGLPFYGRAFHAKHKPFIPNVENIIDVGNVKGGPSDELWNDKCFDNKTLGEHAKNNDNKVYNTVWSFSELIVDFNNNKKWIKSQDEKSKTPYAYYEVNDDRNKYWYYVSYDDEESIKNKVNYVKKKQLSGVMIWEITQDYNNTLLNTINKYL